MNAWLGPNSQQHASYTSNTLFNNKYIWLAGSAGVLIYFGTCYLFKSAEGEEDFNFKLI